MLRIIAMELKQSRAFARLWYLFVALWQAVQLAFLLFCLVSNTWIVSIDSIFSKGLFEQCFPVNLTCVTSDICSNCTGYDSTIICQKSENKTESVDEEFVGGLLVTKIMFRGIVGFISICLFLIDENRGKDFRVEFPKGLTVFEEFCGVCDVAIVGLYLLVNDEFLSANSCSRLGIAFWLNFIRPLTAFIVLRFLFPSTRACARRCFAKTPSDDADQEQNASTDLKLTFQNAEPPDISNEPAGLNYNTDQKRKPSVDLQPTFQKGEQPGTSNESANQKSRTDQEQKPPTDLQSTFQNGEQSGTSNESASEDSKTDLERMSSTEHQPTFQREQPGTSNASQVFNIDMEEKPSTDLQSTFQNGKQPGTSNEPAALDSKTDVKRMSSTEQKPTFQREHSDTTKPATHVSNTDMEEKPSTDLQMTLQNGEQPGTSNEPAALDSKTDLKRMSSAEQKPTCQRVHPDTSNKPATQVSNTDIEQKPVADGQSTFQNGEQPGISNETTSQDSKTDLEQRPSTDSRRIYLCEEQTDQSNEPITRHSTNTDQERKTSINPQSTFQNEEHPVISNEPETQVTKL